MAKIKDNTNKVLQEARRLAREKLEISALLVERTAKEMCPVDTGTLRRSITHVMSVDGKRAFVGTNVDYAPYVEMGTAKMAAQPFLRPALHANRGKIKKIFGA